MNQKRQSHFEINPWMKTFSFLLILWPCLLFSQDFDAENYIRSQYGSVPDSSLAKWTLDSIQFEFEQEEDARISVHSFQLITAADQSFKVFHFLGEQCGGYCNPLYISIVSILNRKDASYSIQEVELFDMQIDSIVVLEPERFFFVFGQSSGRPRGIEGVHGPKVVLVELSSAGLLKNWEFSAQTSNLVEIDGGISSLEFSKKESSIYFTYDWYEDEDVFKSYRRSGIWQYSNGRLKLIKDNKVYHPIIH